jgi:hypothetical protein
MTSACVLVALLTIVSLCLMFVYNPRLIVLGRNVVGLSAVDTAIIKIRSMMMIGFMGRKEEEVLRA